MTRPDRTWSSCSILGPRSRGQRGGGRGYGFRASRHDAYPGTDPRLPHEDHFARTGFRPFRIGTVLRPELQFRAQRSKSNIGPKRWRCRAQGRALGARPSSRARGSDQADAKGRRREEGRRRAIEGRRQERKDGSSPYQPPRPQKKEHRPARLSQAGALTKRRVRSRRSPRFSPWTSGTACRPKPKGEGFQVD